MSKELAIVQPGKALLVFDEPKKELIRKTVAKDLTPLEFEYFISVAQARNLDPILKQIYATKRKGELVFQVGIDGGRVVAARTGDYAGSDAPVFSKDDDNDLVAEVKIWRMVQGHRVSFTGVAYWNEFCPPPPNDFMWKKMPRSQLAKCAEMQALRKGFPNDLGGMYDPAELEREVSEIEKKPGALDDRPKEGDGKWAARVDDLLARCRKIAVSERQICEKYKVASAFELSEEQMDEMHQIGTDIVNKKKKVSDFFKAVSK